MEFVIENVTEVSPEWLTYHLTHLRHFEDCRVKQVTVTHQGKHNTNFIANLSVMYHDLLPHYPQRLFLKIGTDIPNPEVDFYVQIATQMPHPPTPRCYFAGQNDQHYNLLLDDLSETHEALIGWKAQPFEICKKAIDCLSGLHASWWEHPHMPIAKIPDSDKESIAFFADEVKTIFPRFRAKMQANVTTEDFEICKKIANQWLPHMHKRIHSGRGVTIVHGDANFGNFLFERNGNKTVMVDCVTWHRNLGVADLAYMLGMQFESKQRREIERNLISYYHNRITKLKSSQSINYTEEQLWDDYRLLLAHNIIWQIYWWSLGVFSKHTWHNALSAIKDLKCHELLP